LALPNDPAGRIARASPSDDEVVTILAGMRPAYSIALVGIG
jgi:hypothetical protein